jgi:hypothetical protein
MAIGTAKAVTFPSAQALANFLAGGTGAPVGITPPADNTKILGITFDAASGKYTVFYF